MFESIDEKYHEVLEGIGEHGIPIDRLAYWLEGRGIPSLPVFLLLILLIGAGIYMVLNPVYVVTVYNVNGEPLANQRVIVGGKTFITDDAGKIELDFRPESVQVPIPGVSTVFDSESLAVYLEPIVKKVTIIVTGKEGPVNATVQITGNIDVKSYSGSRVTVNLSRVPAKDAIQTNDDGTAKVVVVADGYKTAVKTVDWDEIQDGQTIEIQLEKREPPKAKIYIITDPKIDGYAYLYKDGVDTGRRAAISRGTGTIDNVPYGEYTVVVSVLRDGREYFDPQGRNEKAISVNTPKAEVRISIYVPPKILKTKVRIVDAESGKPVKSAKIRVGTSTIAESGSSGVAIVQIEEGKKITAVVDANGYEAAEVTIPAGGSVTVRLKKIILRGELKLIVEDASGAPVSDAKIVASSKNKRVDAATDENGTARITLPVGTWDIRVLSEGGMSAEKKGVPVEANKSSEIHIVLAPTVRVPITVKVVQNGMEIGTVAEISAVTESGDELWTGATSPAGTATAELPQYARVFFRIKGTVAGEKIIYITRPYVITPGTKVDVVLQNNTTPALVSLENNAGQDVLSIGAGTYTAFIRVACGNNGCTFPIHSDGIKIDGIGASANYPAKLGSDKNKPALILNCNNCILEAPLIVERDGNSTCGTVEVGAGAITMGTAMEIPACQSEICYNTSAPEAARVGDFVNAEVAAIGRIYDMKIMRDAGIKVDSEKVKHCETALGDYYHERATIGFLNKNVNPRAVVTAERGEKYIPINIKILDGNASPIKILVSPEIVLTTCGREITVAIDKNSVKSNAVVQITAGDSTKSYTLPPGSSVEYTLPKKKRIGKIVIHADAPLAFPNTVTVPVYDNVFAIQNTVELSSDEDSGKACDIVNIAYPDENLPEYVGNIVKPLAIVDSAYMNGNEINPDTPLFKKLLIVKERAIEEGADHLTLCLGKAISVPEDAVLEVTYHVKGTAENVECNVASTEGDAKIKLIGDGSCLVGTWVEPKSSKVVNLIKNPREQATFLLQNVCKKTSVKGKVVISMSNTKIQAKADRESFQLEPGQTLKIKVSFDGNSVNGFAAAILTVQIPYTGKGRGHTLGLPPLAVLAGDPSSCVDVGAARFDETRGLVADAKVKRSGGCIGLKVTGMTFNVADSTYTAKCSTGSGGSATCSSKDIPADVIVPMLLEGDKNIDAEISGAIDIRFTSTDIRIHEDNIPLGTAQIPVEKVEAERIAAFTVNCRVENRTPFPGGITISGEGAVERGDEVTIPPKESALPPGSATTVDVCQGAVSTSAILIAGGKQYDLGSCDYRPEPATFLTVPGPSVKGTVAYVPSKEIKTYAYAIVGGRLVPADIWNLPCAEAPCDANRAMLDVVAWLANYLAHGGEKEINVILATNENVEPWNVDATVGDYNVSTRAYDDGTYPGYVLTDVRASQKIGDQWVEITDKNVYISEQIPAVFGDYNAEGSCDVVRVSVRKTGDENYFVEATCEVSGTALSALKNMMGNDPALFHGLAMALVNIGDSKPFDGGFGEMYPVTGWFTKGSGESRAIIPSITKVGDSEYYYVEGVGKVPRENIRGDCDAPALKVWEIQPAIGYQTSPYDGQYVSITRGDDGKFWITYPEIAGSNATGGSEEHEEIIKIGGISLPILPPPKFPIYIEEPPIEPTE